MPDLLWAFENVAVRDAGALPPVPLELDYGVPRGAPARDLPRAAALGRPVTPADCGPVRVISRYGFAVRCPGKVVLRRAGNPSADRHFADDHASFGHAVIGGDRWPQGDSGFIASWLSGSEYVKVQTGVMLFFPRDVYLYQGPLPNAQLVDGPHLDVMAGMEYPSKDRLWPAADGDLAWSSINVIVRLPPHEETVELAAGDPLCWVFAAPARSTVSLRRMDMAADGSARPVGAR